MTIIEYIIIDHIKSKIYFQKYIYKNHYPNHSHLLRQNNGEAKGNCIKFSYIL